MRMVWQIVLMLMLKNDDKVSDLTSMEVDKTLSNEQVIFFVVLPCTSRYMKKIQSKNICTNAIVHRYKKIV